MVRVLLGATAGITVLTVIISLLVYMEWDVTGSRSDDGKTFTITLTLDGRSSNEDGTVIIAKDENNNGDPIKLVAICENEGTKNVKCTWIPLDESKRTPEEKELAERAK